MKNRSFHSFLENRNLFEEHRIDALFEELAELMVAANIDPITFNEGVLDDMIAGELDPLKKAKLIELKEQGFMQGVGDAIGKAWGNVTKGFSDLGHGYQQGYAGVWGGQGAQAMQQAIQQLQQARQTLAQAGLGNDYTSALDNFIQSVGQQAQGMQQGGGMQGGQQEPVTAQVVGQGQQGQPQAQGMPPSAQAGPQQGQQQGGTHWMAQAMGDAAKKQKDQQAAQQRRAQYAKMYPHLAGQATG